MYKKGKLRSNELHPSILLRGQASWIDPAAYSNYKSNMIPYENKKLSTNRTVINCNIQCVQEHTEQQTLVQNKNSLIPLKSKFSFKIICEKDSQVRINTSISQSGSYITATGQRDTPPSRWRLRAGHRPLAFLQPQSATSSDHENWICWTPEICW